MNLNKNQENQEIKSNNVNVNMQERTSLYIRMNACMYNACVE